MTKQKIGWTVAVWWLGHITLIGSHVVFVFLYSLARPGQSNAQYQEFALASGPWFSIVFGIPVFLWLGRLLRKRLGLDARGSGLTAWALYSATDLAIVIAAHAAWTPLFIGQWCLSQGVKLLAVLRGTATTTTTADR